MLKDDKRWDHIHSMRVRGIFDDGVSKTASFNKN